ncbi:MgtC/SapB family protein [Anaerobacillus sp. MEB173]|uniref:MgtC/SapB family protein n=1 Tax=Anaerobacillus sp. MEB173 TaxID=3383345 RepID=UPI003F92FB59
MDILISNANINYQDIYLKLIIAFVFGAIIGLERSLKRKNASLKTTIVLCITSCIVTIVSIYSAQIYSEMTDSTMMDPLRLAAQLISGIGFIGAGVILVRNNDVVSGITTAAILWASVGFGIAIGAGFFVEAAVALILMMVGVELLPILLKLIGVKPLKEKELKARIIVDNEEKLTEILKEMKKNKMIARKVRVRDLKDQEYKQLDLIILVHEKSYTTDIYFQLKQIEHIVSVDIESL